MLSVNNTKAICKALGFVFLTFLMIVVSSVLRVLKVNPGRRTRMNQHLVRLMASACAIEIVLEQTQTANLEPAKTTLYLANHLSYLDVVILGACFPCNFLAKKEVSEWPLVGWCARATGCEFVAREFLHGRVSALLRIRSRLKKENMCVFPEGSTTSDDIPSKELWRRGQIWCALPEQTQVVCVGLCYEDQTQLAWIDDMEFVPHLWSVFKRQKTRVFVSAAPLTVAADECVTIPELANLAYEAVSRMCERSHVSRVQHIEQAVLPTSFASEGVHSCSHT